MTSRRSFLSAAALTAAAAALHPLPGFASTHHAAPGIARRAIPSTGETIPVIGMGTSGSFEVGGDPGVQLKEVLRIFFEAGGRMIDTSPNYSNAEDVVGALLADGGWRDNQPLVRGINVEDGRLVHPALQDMA